MSSTWVGIGELVVAKLDSTGKVSGTPYQHTEITASSSGPVEVQVPMSDSGLRDLGKGKPPPVSDGKGDFSLTPNGTTTQNVRSDLATQLPLTVTPTYELDGKSTTAADLEPTKHHLKKQYKSGTLHVTYKIANVSKATTSVSFEGFNGARVQKAITQPLPIVAEVKLTFPKSATDISAPNAALATGVSGVGATWTIALAPPLTPATQTISYTVQLGEVKIPTTTVEAEVLTPNAAPSGAAPAKAAATLASLEGTAEQGLSGPSVSLGGVHADLDRPQRSTSSRLDAEKRSRRSANGKGRRSSSSSDLQDAFAALTQSQTSSSKDTGDTAATQLSNLQSTANQALNDLADQGTAGSSQLTTDLTSAMTAMTQSISSLATAASANTGGQHDNTALADALQSATTALVSLVTDLVQVVHQHAQDVSALDVLVVKLIRDANAFPSGVKATSDWGTLALDLETSKAKADLASQAAAAISHEVDAVASAVQDLQSKVDALDEDAHRLEADAGQIGNRLHSDVAAKESALQASIGHVSDLLGSVDSQLAAGQAQVATTKSDADAKLSTVEAEGSATVASATDQAKASAEHAIGTAQQTLDKANDDYAQLLALSQIANAHQLPGGNASGANAQNGAWVYRISGTG
jgi:hypothetical protein